MPIDIYFTDSFGIEPGTLDTYGAFDISLINDLPLFIDPFLLFASQKPEYKRLHENIIDYLKFLRDRSAAGLVSDGLLQAWFMFPELKQTWLGFSLTGNNGRGLGRDFAKALNRNLNVIFSNFGEEKITEGSHLEKVCLVKDGVGRDNISDFTTNLIKKYLLDYTHEFANQHIAPERTREVSVAKVEFDYELEVWLPGTYTLPHAFGDFVVLTPKDMLTKDESWLNRSDLLARFGEVAESVPNSQLREQVNNYLAKKLRPDSRRDEEKAAYDELLQRYPDLIEYYIKGKEVRKVEAVENSARLVSETEQRFIFQIRRLAEQLQLNSKFYEYGTDTLEEARSRLEFLKQEIENNGAYRLFYHEGVPLQREADLQILYRLTWYGTPSDFNSEVNNGRGPVDFTASRGSKDKSLIEFKLAKNSKLAQNLEKQVAVYEAANRTSQSLKAIFYFSQSEKEKVLSILNGLGLEDDESIVLIDCRDDNKPSASNVR
jgi:hypothetical protein